MKKPYKGITPVYFVVRRWLPLLTSIKPKIVSLENIYFPNEPTVKWTKRMQHFSHPKLVSTSEVILFAGRWRCSRPVMRPPKKRLTKLEDCQFSSRCILSLCCFDWPYRVKKEKGIRLQAIYTRSHYGFLVFSVILKKKCPRKTDFRTIIWYLIA